jgi:hypothetical protein
MVTCTGVRGSISALARTQVVGASVVSATMPLSGLQHQINQAGCWRSAKSA